MSYAKSFLKRREKSNTGKAEYKSADKIFGRKKLIFAVTLLVIFAVLILLKLEFGTGRVRQAKLMLNESEIYSQKELMEAVDTLKKEFFWKMSGCELQAVSYKEWIPYRITSQDRKENNIGAEEEVIVLSVDYVQAGDFHSFFGYAPWIGNVEGENWLIARKNSGEPWRVAGILGEG